MKTIKAIRNKIEILFICTEDSQLTRFTHPRGLPLWILA